MYHLLKIVYLCITLDHCSKFSPCWVSNFFKDSDCPPGITDTILCFDNLTCAYISLSSGYSNSRLKSAFGSIFSHKTEGSIGTCFAGKPEKNLTKPFGNVNEWSTLWRTCNFFHLFHICLISTRHANYSSVVSPIESEENWANVKRKTDRHII